MENRVLKIVSIWSALVAIFAVSIASANNCNSQSRFALWNNTVTGEAPSGELSLEGIASQHAVRIERRQYNTGDCFSYNIIDATTGQPMGVIPLSFEDSDPDNFSPEELAQLSQRLGHMMQTDRSQLIALAQARRTFLEDSLAMDEEMGIMPQSLSNPLELSGNGVQVGYSSVECLADGTLQSPNPIAGSEVTIGHLEYRPDVQSYQSIYEEGQIRLNLGGNAQALDAIRSRITSNMTNIEGIMNHPDQQSEIPDVAASAPSVHSCARNNSDFERNVTLPLAGITGLQWGKGQPGGPSVTGVGVANED